LDVTNAGSSSMFEDQSARPGMNKTFAEEVEVILTADSTTAIAGTIYLDVFYVVD
jgi:hypothetical protein